VLHPAVAPADPRAGAELEADAVPGVLAVLAVLLQPPSAATAATQAATASGMTLVLRRLAEFSIQQV